MVRSRRRFPSRRSTRRSKGARAGSPRRDIKSRRRPRAQRRASLTWTDVAVAARGSISAKGASRDARSAGLRTAGSKSGLKFTQAADGRCDPSDPNAPQIRGHHWCGLFLRQQDPPALKMDGGTLGDVAHQLSAYVDREVIDKTAIEGRFDFTIGASAAELF